MSHVAVYEASPLVVLGWQAVARSMLVYAFVDLDVNVVRKLPFNALWLPSNEFLLLFNSKSAEIHIK
jgi:hypothetical protein